MEYNEIYKAKFINRPNRFIANIEINGKKEICHVKNTGRCKEILIKDADIFVQKSDKEERKTKYDLISVYKGKNLINIDSQVPNKVFHEWAKKSNMFGEISLIKGEKTYKNSRFDFYMEWDEPEKKTLKKAFIEIKGVTLEEDGVALFPDAPTIRGVKHINELIDCKKEGYEAFIFFIIQMKGIKYFSPNTKMHKDFADALILAKKAGVNIFALDCYIDEKTITAQDFIEVRL